jgi:ABC-2 type transport system permease protein
MTELSEMIWVEWRKAFRSRMPLWTGLGALLMPLGIAFLIYVARNPEVAHRLGLISAKANLIAYSATDWATYLGLLGQMVAAGGFFLFVLAVSWAFGREWAEGTLQDLLAVPVARSSIVLAKCAVVAAWSAGLAAVILAAGLVMGVVIGLPGGSSAVILQGSALVLIVACLAIAVTLPFAFFASAGRGYLLPIGVALLTALLTNLVAMIGWGEYLPWAAPGLYAQGKDSLAPVSYWIVLLTGLAGLGATHLWWRHADQNR